MSAILSFILAMVLHPKIQLKAQAELDAVLGPIGTRLPRLEDRGKLPFIENVFWEVLRWNTVLNLG